MSKKNKGSKEEETLPEMPLSGHLIELRSRLLLVLVLFVIAFVVCYQFSQEIFMFHVEPLAKLLEKFGDRRLIYTGLPEAFLTYMKVSLFAAFVFVFPVLSYQMWRFICPGLYASEKKSFLGYIIASPLLFLMGAAFAFYIVIPQAWAFFLSFETPQGAGVIPIQLEARVSEYLSMTLTMMVAFGLSFQLPLILVALGRYNIISKEGLVKARKYSFVGILILSAALTPPDVLSMIGLAIPLYALYETSVFLVGMSKTTKQKDTP